MNKINFNIRFYLPNFGQPLHEHLSHHVLCSSSTQVEPEVAVEYHQSTGCHKDKCLNLVSVEIVTSSVASFFEVVRSGSGWSTQLQFAHKN